MNDEFNRNTWAYSYKKPQMVAKLPPKTNLNTGKMETVDVKEGAEDYYDGTTKLRGVARTNSCQGLQKSTCLKSQSCGWCGSSSSCIKGSSLGPGNACLSGTFIYASPKVNISQMTMMNA